MKHLKDCAINCKGVSSVFIFGTNYYGGNSGKNRCYSEGDDGGEGCQCNCATSAFPDGTCITKEHLGYRLFTFENGKILYLDRAFYLLLDSSLKISFLYL